MPSARGPAAEPIEVDGVTDLAAPVDRVYVVNAATGQVLDLRTAWPP